MSTLITDELRGSSQGNHIISIPNNNTLYAPGHVIQTVWRKFDQHATYNSYNDNVSRDISGLDLTITLKNSNSLVYCKWWLFYEAHHDITFQAKRNGTVVGFNTEAGNVRWSGIGCAEYEHSHDQNSTPSYAHFCYIDQPGTVGPHTYSLGSRASAGTNYDIRVNRAWGNFTDNHEAGVSWAMIEEIAQ
jgi:hypothetical protein